MGHSVRNHLAIEIQSYDREIRRFIPGYQSLLDMASREVVRNRPNLVLDLGAGTGALAEAILSTDDAVNVELIDIDPEMLAQARERLAKFTPRTRFSRHSFRGRLPACDGAAASLSLHHIRTIQAKRAVYQSIYEAILPGGTFANADAAVPADPAARATVLQGWVEHMAGCGIERHEGYAHLERWAEEDTYFPLEEELEAVESAGFVASCAWRHGPMAVIVGRKHSG
ncbi:MAG: class I SAM-dependent methyltransferase [Bryobacterales bacterium]|nr:class I SAM-dependent methyltransferase [Bryobacterales bacterium]